MVPGERRDRATAIAISGLAPDDFDAYSTALGFMPIHGAPPGEVGYTDDEIETLSLVGHLAAMFSPSEVLTLIRVIGGSLSRIAEAAVSLFLVDVEVPHLLSGMSELELARKVFDAVGLVDGLAARLDPVLRRQIQQAIERNRRSTIGASERLQYRYAVGFVDLVGFTALSGRLPAEELAAFLGRFEADAHDVVAHHGARVVKLIGDEVMFVATDAASACAAALGLVEAFSSGFEGVVPRGGLAYGNVLLRGGDYYGTVVNLASRLVDLAVPMEVLVTEAVAEAAPACRFDPAGRRVVKGFDEPVTVRSLTR
jgi:adenylate cyclase